MKIISSSSRQQHFASTHLNKHILFDANGFMAATILELNIDNLITSKIYSDALSEFLHVLISDKSFNDIKVFLYASIETIEWISASKIQMDGWSWLIDVDSLKTLTEKKRYDLAASLKVSTSLLSSPDNLALAIAFKPDYVFVDHNQSPPATDNIKDFNALLKNVKVGHVNTSHDSLLAINEFYLIHGAAKSNTSADWRKERGQFSNLANIAQEIRLNGLTAVQIRNKIASEPTLVVKILKMVNSVFYKNSTKKVSTLSEAIVLIGVNKILNLIYVTMIQELEPTSKSLIFESLVKAFMTEKLYLDMGFKGEPETAFLVGLMSHIHILLGIPQQDAIREASLPDAIVTSIIEFDGCYGKALNIVNQFLSGDWDPHLSESVISQCIAAYSSAIDSAANLKID